MWQCHRTDRGVGSVQEARRGWQGTRNIARAVNINFSRKTWVVLSRAEAVKESRDLSPAERRQRICFLSLPWRAPSSLEAVFQLWQQRLTLSERGPGVSSAEAAAR